MSSTDVPSSKLPPENQKNGSVPSSNVETLPEGFFDDPVLDAKVRMKLDILSSFVTCNV